MHYFRRDSSYWKNLTEDKIEALMTLELNKESETEKRYWDNWQSMFKSMFGK